VSAAVDYTLCAVEQGEHRVPSVPGSLLDQARLAAQNSVPLDLVIRRYLSGFLVLSNFIAEEEESNGVLRAQALRRMLQGHTAQVDRLVEIVAQAYTEECERAIPSEQKLRVDRTKRLLNGEPLGLGDYGYELRNWHLGIVADGDSSSLVQELANRLDAASFCVSPRGAVTWGWVGSAKPLDSATLSSVATVVFQSEDRVAIGETAKGPAGWRLTHQQAKAAFAVGLAGEVALYRDVAVISCVLRDETLTASLKRKYLDPLAEERDGGSSVRQALRAYFASGQKIGAAAAVLQLSRQTVRGRLRSFEEKICRSLDECGVEVEIALAIDRYQLDRGTSLWE